MLMYHCLSQERQGVPVACPGPKSVLFCKLGSCMWKLQNHNAPRQPPDGLAGCCLAYCSCCHHGHDLHIITLCQLVVQCLRPGNVALGNETEQFGAYMQGSVQEGNACASQKLMHDAIVACWHMLHCLKFKGTIGQCMSSSHTATVMCA